MVVPARVRSAYGDMTKAAAGSGSPWSRALTKVAMASPPPADSPAKAMDMLVPARELRLLAAGRTPSAAIT